MHPDHERLPSFTSDQSSPEDWALRARMFMDKGEYSLAEHCFRNADLWWDCNIANAYRLREDADTLDRWKCAAEAFEHCANDPIGKISPKYNELIFAAAGCYSRARELRRSGQLYGLAQDFGRSAEQFCNGNFMEDAYRVTLTHRAQVSQRVFERVCLYFFSLHQVEYVTMNFIILAIYV